MSEYIPFNFLINTKSTCNVLLIGNHTILMHVNCTTYRRLFMCALTVKKESVIYFKVMYKLVQVKKEYVTTYFQQWIMIIKRVVIVFAKIYIAIVIVVIVHCAYNTSIIYICKLLGSKFINIIIVIKSIYTCYLVWMFLLVMKICPFHNIKYDGIK